MPDRYIDGIDAITDPGDDARQDHLDPLRRRSLEYSADDHDPASPHDTTLATEAIRGQKREDCAEEAAYVVHSGDDALDIAVGIVEFISEGG